MKSSLATHALVWSVALLFFGNFHYAWGQWLSLEDALKTAKEKSPVAIQIRARYQARYWDFKANEALLRPQLNLNAQVPGFTRTINQITQPDGSILFRPQSQNFSSSTLSLSQNLLATGGTLSLNSGLSRIDLFENEGTKAQYYWRSAPLFISYTQPLFRINQIKWNWKQQKIGFDLEKRRQIELLEELSIDVTAKFFELLIAGVQFENAQANLKSNDTIFRISQGRFQIGKIAENELLQTELGLMNAKNASERAALRMLTSRKELINLLGKNEDAGHVQVLLPYRLPQVRLDPEKAQAEARENRSDYKNLELNENLAQMNLRANQISRRFTADLNLTVGYNQTATDFSSAFKNLQSQQSAFIGVTVPLHNSGRNRALVKQSEEELKATLANTQNRKNELNIEVLNRVLQLNQLKTSVEISAKADTIAQRRYEMAKNRYLIGKIDITNLTIAQQEKDEALVAYLQTLRDFWLAWYQLRRITLYDFETQQKIE